MCVSVDRLMWGKAVETLGAIGRHAWLPALGGSLSTHPLRLGRTKMGFGMQDVPGMHPLWIGMWTCRRLGLVPDRWVDRLAADSPRVEF